MSEHVLEVHAVENGVTAKAIVILFGWLGSQPKHIQKYAKLYQDRQCSTIHGGFSNNNDVVPIMLAQTDLLQSLVLDVVREATKLLQASADDDASNIPVVVHSFSGAGCILLEQLKLMITEANVAQAAAAAAADKKAVTLQQQQQEKDLILFGEAMQRGGQVFDSAPAYLSLVSGLNAIRLAVPNIFMRFLIQAFLCLFALFQWAANINHAETHWSHFEQSNMVHLQAYIYSANDLATNAEKLDQMIAHRKQIMLKTTVLVHKFADSPHCAHLLKHPKEYQTLLDSFFQSIAQQQKESHKFLDQDPDMTDYQLEMD